MCVDGAFALWLHIASLPTRSLLLGLVLLMRLLECTTTTMPHQPVLITATQIMSKVRIHRIVYAKNTPRFQTWRAKIKRLVSAVVTFVYLPFLTTLGMIL